MSNYAKDVIKIAQAEIGYLEKASNKGLDSKTENAGKKNFTKYARDLDAIAGFYNGKKQGFAWCDVFTDWCFVQAFGVSEAKKLLCQPAKSLGAGCKYSMQYYKDKGQLKTSPKVGDQIFFKDADGDISHTGLVYNVDKTYVYTIEGNTSSDSGVVANGGSVRAKKYKLTYTRIAGYGRPAYDKEPVATSAKKSVTEIAKEVLAGKWGNGSERKAALEKAGYNYDEVQKKVNELSKGAPSADYQCIHTVKKGESLWLLATRYLGSGTRYTEIMKLNGKKNATITVGEKVKIPNK